MILKVFDSWMRGKGQWVLIDGVSHVAVDDAQYALKHTFSDDEGPGWSYDYDYFFIDFIMGINSQEPGYDDNFTVCGNVVEFKEHGFDRKLFFNTTAYLMNDDGRTIETLRFKFKPKEVIDTVFQLDPDKLKAGLEFLKEKKDNDKLAQ